MSTYHNTKTPELGIKNEKSKYEESKHNGWVRQWFINNVIIAEYKIVCNVSMRHLVQLLVKYSQRNRTIK